MRKLVILAISIVMAVTLSACGLGSKTSVDQGSPEQTQTPTNGQKANGQRAESKEQPNSKGQANTNDTGGADAPTSSQKDLSKKIEVVVEGEKELRPANLAKSRTLDYEIYVLDGYSLEAEEPGKDVILSKFDGEFFVRIEKLSEKTNIAQYQSQQKAGFSQVGKVTDIEPATLSHKGFQDAKFCFLTEAGEVKNGQTKTSIIYLVKEFNGKLFDISLYMPLKEAAEGITPSLWAMLSTMEAH